MAMKASLEGTIMEAKLRNAFAVGLRMVMKEFAEENVGALVDGVGDASATGFSIENGHDVALVIDQRRHGPPAAAGEDRLHAA